MENVKQETKFSLANKNNFSTSIGDISNITDMEGG
jgi:hypothetical protein